MYFLGILYLLTNVGMYLKFLSRSVFLYKSSMIRLISISCFIYITNFNFFEDKSFFHFLSSSFQDLSTIDFTHNKSLSSINKLIFSINHSAL